VTTEGAGMRRTWARKENAQAMLHIKKKFGKNAILREWTWRKARRRRSNEQIGGHKA
jgi:hypothetical protein